MEPGEWDIAEARDIGVGRRHAQRARRADERHLPGPVFEINPNARAGHGPRQAGGGRTSRKRSITAPVTALKAHSATSARPPGAAKTIIDAYAVMAGLNGMAHPSDGIVELAVRLDRPVHVTPACCSIAVGDEVMALDPDDGGLVLDVQAILKQEQQRRRLKDIRVVSQATGSGT